jgi:hypothetical protein
MFVDADVLSRGAVASELRGGAEEKLRRRASRGSPPRRLAAAADRMPRHEKLICLVARGSSDGTENTARTQRAGGVSHHRRNRYSGATNEGWGSASR